MIKQCKKCGSENLYLEPRIEGQDVMTADMVALKCKGCGSWLKWCPKDERQFYINKKQENKVEQCWVIQRDDGKFFYDIGIVDDYSPYFCDDILICLLNGGRFKARKDAQIYINKFLQNCHPVKVELRVVGE